MSHSGLPWRQPEKPAGEWQTDVITTISSLSRIILGANVNNFNAIYLQFLLSSELDASHDSCLIYKTRGAAYLLGRVQITGIHICWLILMRFKTDQFTSSSPWPQSRNNITQDPEWGRQVRIFSGDPDVPHRTQNWLNRSSRNAPCILAGCFFADTAVLIYAFLQCLWQNRRSFYAWCVLACWRS